MFLGFLGGSRGRETETSSAHFADEALGVTPGMQEMVTEEQAPESVPEPSLLPAAELAIAPEPNPTHEISMPESVPSLSLAPAESVSSPVMPEVSSVKPEIAASTVTAPEILSSQPQNEPPARMFVHKVLQDLAA